jgi:hypothetical protein
MEVTFETEDKTGLFTRNISGLYLGEAEFESYPDTEYPY